MGFVDCEYISEMRFLRDRSLVGVPGEFHISDTIMVTGSMIEEVYGERSPSVDQSQKEFDLICLIISDPEHGLLNLAEISYMDKTCKYFGESHNGRVTTDRNGQVLTWTTPSFSAATLGYGKLNTKVSALP